ncbi:MAG: hypothetical protein ACOC0A_03160, partial [Planctomycetota bacterium]
MAQRPIISGWTIQRVLNARPGNINISLDLGLHRCNLQLDVNALKLPDQFDVSLAVLQEIDPAAEDCFLLSPEGGVRKVYIYSDDTRKYYKLYQPEEDVAPTIVIAGATMHTIVDKTPWGDADEKTNALLNNAGACLDTCFGLGYSAQLLQDKGYAKVVSCEKDPNVLRIARTNPWSCPAFEREDVRIVENDVRDFLTRCRDKQFASIFHDPPTIHQAGELYSGELYQEFYRVLQPRGIFYHYVGDPGGKRG